MTNDDQALVDLLRLDRRQGLRALMEEHHRFLAGMAYRILDDEQAASDAVQQLYIRIFQSRWHFDGRSSFKTFLARIVVNICRDILRTQKRRERLMEAWARDAGPCEGSETADPLGADLVRAALKRLPPEFRLPLQLCEWEGMKYEEIAAVLRIPINTVRSRIARARTRLGALLVAAGAES